MQSVELPWYVPATISCYCSLLCAFITIYVYFYQLTNCLSSVNSVNIQHHILFLNYQAFVFLVLKRLKLFHMSDKKTFVALASVAMSLFVAHKLNPF